MSIFQSRRAAYVDAAKIAVKHIDGVDLEDLITELSEDSRRYISRITTDTDTPTYQDKKQRFMQKLIKHDIIVYSDYQQPERVTISEGGRVLLDTYFERLYLQHDATS